MERSVSGHSHPFLCQVTKWAASQNIDQDWGWIHAGVDRFAVLYDMWTWEATLLENKRQVSSPRNKTSIKHSYNAQYIYF